MSKLEFRSSLAGRLAEFVAEKRAVGYRYVTEANRLEVFDRYLIAAGHTGTELPRAAVQGWCAKRQHESWKNHRARVCVVRQFARFLLRQGCYAYVPDSRVGPVCGNNFKPWIFTHRQIKDVLAAVDAVHYDCRAPRRHLVIRELFRVLYGCGLRCGEVVRLTVGDVDLNEGVLTIREGKFRQDRLVPMAVALADRLRVYSRTLDAPSPDSTFFPGRDGGAYSHQRIYDMFRRVLRSAGISHGGVGVGPRLHDLRATFAVHRVEAWLREGADLGAKLPILSAYMGHLSLAGTQRYLRLTQAIFPNLASLFEHAYGHLLPRLPPC